MVEKANNVIYFDFSKTKESSEYLLNMYCMPALTNVHNLLQRSNPCQVNVNLQTRYSEWGSGLPKLTRSDQRTELGNIQLFCPLSTDFLINTPHHY